MRLLQRKFEVETRYGGGFVQEIDGVGGGREAGRPVDWFFYVNGIEAEHRRRRAQARRPATACGGTTTTGAPRCASRPSSAPSPSRSCRPRRASGSRCGSTAARAPSARAARCRSGSRTRARRSAGRRSSARRRAAACCACSSGAGPTSAATRRRAGSSRGRRPPASSPGRRPTGDRIELLDARGGVACGRSAPAPASSPRRASSTSSRPGSWRAPTTSGVDAAAAALNEIAAARPLRGRGRERPRDAGAGPAAGGRSDGEPVTYRRRASPLHAARAGVGSLYCVVLAGVALSFEHPLAARRRCCSRCCWRAPARGSATWSRARCCGGCRSRC